MSKLHVLFRFGPSAPRLHSALLIFFFPHRSFKTVFDAFKPSFSTVGRATGAPITPPQHAVPNICLMFLSLFCLASSVHATVLDGKNLLSQSDYKQVVAAVFVMFSLHESFPLLCRKLCVLSSRQLCSNSYVFLTFLVFFHQILLILEHCLVALHIKVRDIETSDRQWHQHLIRVIE